MKQIPCIKNKCILYPVCKNKEVVSCDILTDWLKLGEGSVIYRWSLVYKTFTNTHTLIDIPKGKCIMVTQEYTLIRK